MFSRKLMGLCRENLPEYTGEFIPDLVHDFVWNNKEELKKLLNEEE